MTGAALLRKAQLKHRPDRTFSRCSLRRSGLQLRGVRGETRRALRRASRQHSRSFE
jgi:hypothetical protein